MHASAFEVDQILNHACINSKISKDQCERVANACDIGARSGREIPKKKISLSQVNEAINEAIQLEFMVSYINEQKHFLLNTICAGTSYNERVIVQKPSAKTMTVCL